MRAQLLFVALPYLAAAGLIVASLWRILQRRGDSAPSVAADAIPGGTPWAWRWGLGALLAGHLAAFLAPGGFAWLHGWPLAILLLGLLGWLAAGLALWGLAQRLWRLRSMRISWADSALLTLLALQLLSGLGAALVYRWSSQWYAATVLAYLGSLARFEPDVALVSGLPAWVRLHLVGGFLTVGLVPFTRLGFGLGLSFSRARRWPERWLGWLARGRREAA